MSTETRKQREIRQREELLLDVGRRMLIEEGYAGLNMDRIAEATEYAKGTVYQHFISKEDLIMALACRSMERRQGLFEKAVAFKGSPRERLLALAVAEELFVTTHPHHFRAEQIVHMAALETKVKPERTAQFRLRMLQCLGVAKGVVQEAVVKGHLALAPTQTAADVVFGLYGVAVGMFTAVTTQAELFREFGVLEPRKVFWSHCRAYLDGLGLRPFHSTAEHAQIVRRVQEEIFADEFAQASLV
jgi:AcrR family transcriptional regulator